MDKYDTLKIENQLCFPLYVAAKEIVKSYTPYLSKLDLTYTQYITMMVIWERKEINVKELGEILYLDSGTLTPLLKKLEIKELITRERSKIDERNLLVKLTQKGKTLKKEAVDIPHKVGKCIDLSPEEVLTLRKLLKKLFEGKKYNL